MKDTPCGVCSDFRAEGGTAFAEMHKDVKEITGKRTAHAATMRAVAARVAADET